MLNTVLKTSRPPFLLLAPLCVLVALAYANFLSIQLDVLDVVLCFTAAVLAHASVNMLNEFHDYQSGLDELTDRTPFSGGSGSLQQIPQAANIVKIIGLLLLFITVIIGLYFVVKQGVSLLILGLLATASVMFYTPNINRMPWVCLIAPGFGFGIAFVVGSFVALTGQWNFDVFILALPILVLTNNLLLLNQFPDKSADEQSGRKHLIIRYGMDAGRRVYALNSLCVVALTLLIALRFEMGLWASLLLLPNLASGFSFLGIKRYIETSDLNRFMPHLASNVIATLIYPAILSLLLFIT